MKNRLEPLTKLSVANLYEQYQTYKEINVFGFDRQKCDKLLKQMIRYGWTLQGLQRFLRGEK